MKTYRSEIFRGLNILLVVFSIISFMGLHSSIKMEQEIKREKEEVTFVSQSILPSTPRVVKVAKAKVKPKKIVTQVVNTMDTSSYPVLATYSGNISHYGPDCVGCSGITASGYNISNGNMYYKDKTYGTVKIVAADRKIPFGTIIRIKSGDKTQLAIVLDRGGAIGFNGQFLFDMVCQSEAESYQLGVMRNVTVDVLRYGY